MTLHRPAAERYLERHPFDGPRLRYRMACTCGAVDETGVDKYSAGASVARHLDEVAAPPHLRCAMPRSHGMRWWDACPVCTGQPALFGGESP